MTNFEKFVSGILFSLFIGIGILFFLVFRLDSQVKSFLSSNPDFSDSAGTTVVNNSNVDSSEPIDISIAKKQIEILEASSEALLKRVAELEDEKLTTKYVSVTNNSEAFQKQIIHIGSTSTKENDWSNSGIEVVLNTQDYPSNIDATFEAGIAIIGGEGWARLVNKTTGAVMAISEVHSNTSETTWVSSPKFKLHSGANMYEVQVRSTSGEVATFSGARIILTN